jgi:glutathione S-transferase
MQLLANNTSPFVRIARVAMIEKGLDVEPTIVDPWADDARLRAANAATRVPTLVLDNGTPLSECLLIVQWLEATRPAPDWPSLLGKDSAGVLSRAGIAIGTAEAATITIITRKVTAPAARWPKASRASRRWQTSSCRRAACRRWCRRST